MSLDFLTVLLIIFVFLMYIYLYLVRSSVLIKGKKNRLVRVGASILALLMFFIAFTTDGTTNQLIRNILSALMLLSFNLDSKGLTEDRIITTPFDKSGTLYTDIEKIVLLKKADEIRMNYFKNGRRGPLITFIIPLEEMIPFLAKRLNEETELSIIIDEENG